MIGRLIDLCAKNRWFVIFTFLVVAFGATAAVRRIPLDAIPDLSDPQVIVFTESPRSGATRSSTRSRSIPSASAPLV